MDEGGEPARYIIQLLYDGYSDRGKYICGLLVEGFLGWDLHPLCGSCGVPCSLSPDIQTQAQTPDWTGRGGADPDRLPETPAAVLSLHRGTLPAGGLLARPGHGRHSAGGPTHNTDHLPAEETALRALDSDFQPPRLHSLSDLHFINTEPRILYLGFLYLG